MKIIRLDITTDASGDGSATHSEVVQGLLYAVRLVDGSFDDGVDVTVTDEQQGSLSVTLLIKANFNTDQMVYPRVLEALNTDGSALTTGCLQLIVGKPKVVIAAGGDVKTGAVILYIFEGAL